MPTDGRMLKGIQYAYQYPMDLWLGQKYVRTRPEQLENGYELDGFLLHYRVCCHKCMSETFPHQMFECKHIKKVQKRSRSTLE